VSRQRPVHPAVDLEADLDTLVEERDFLLRSLRDLEAEHQAGDLDEVDYRSLKDDYTARAADVLRAIEDRRSPRRRPARSASPSEPPAPVLAAERSRRRWRTLAITAGVLLFAVLAGWAVTATSGSRLPGQTVTGNSNLRPSTTTAAAGAAAAETSLAQQLSRAGQLVTEQKVADALRAYDQILKDNPNQPEALANSGWLIAQAGMASNPVRQDLVDTALARIRTAEQAAPSYPDPHFFRGFLLLRAKNDGPGAVTELRTYLGMVDPSSPQYPAVTRLLNQALAAAGTGPTP
jgi:tetratricopeptide (TPR) repeat protein